MPEPKKLADGRYECQNCLRKFTKGPKTTVEPKFCRKSCCDEFHINGGMSLRKLKDKMGEIARTELAPLLSDLNALGERVAALESRNRRRTELVRAGAVKIVDLRGKKSSR